MKFVLTFFQIVLCGTECPCRQNQADNVCQDPSRWAEMGSEGGHLEAGAVCTRGLLGRSSIYHVVIAAPEVLRYEYRVWHVEYSL